MADIQKATLGFLIRGTPPREILLGYKQRGLGAGKYNGVGGKVMSTESIETAFMREIFEEVGVRAQPEDLLAVGRLQFEFPRHTAWEQEVHLFLLKRWEGEPQRTEEIRPEWFAVDAIPYARMWADDAHWLPSVLRGRRVEGWFRYRPDGETIDCFELSVCEPGAGGSR